jgi:glycosyltransferase involved in cell wall biosynthesis
MKIWHSRAFCSPNKVDGVNSLIYSVAKEQVGLGHEVFLVIDNSPDEAARRFAQETEVRFLQLPAGWVKQISALSKALRDGLPDIVHMHSVFIPQQAIFCRVLKSRSIPFVITPNGGLSPYILARSRWKKVPYSRFIERPRFHMATGISVVTSRETEEVLSFVPGFERPVRCIPNAVELGPLEGYDWCPPTLPKVTYLGRFDIVHKGLDLMLELARRSPHIEFHLYGPDDQASRTVSGELAKSSPSNVSFHSPVYGAEKAKVLANSTMYIQMSRWEAFGISIAEAMYLGLPCAVASSAHISSLLDEQGLGLVLPPDLAAATEALRNAISDPAQLEIWSSKAKQFAHSNFHPRAVALEFVAFYHECISHQQE